MLLQLEEKPRHKARIVGWGVVEQDDLIAFCNIFRHFQVLGIQSEAFIILGVWAQNMLAGGIKVHHKLVGRQESKPIQTLQKEPKEFSRGLSEFD